MIVSISPGAAKLKKYVKIPLVINLLVTSVICYNASVMYKLSGELLINNGLRKAPFLTLLLPIIGLSQTLLQLYIINIAMSLYEQMTIVPIY